MDFDVLRAQMVDRQLISRGIRDRRVLDAFRAVPRELFVPDELREFAYEDSALPISCGQTISQPYIVALTIESMNLRGGERVLEIGTGTGYAAAVLCQIAEKVYSVERIPSLAESARDRLSRLGYQNVLVSCADGTLGWPEYAPYDAIAASAGGPRIPRALSSQLAPGGHLVIPIGLESSSQVLVRVTRDGDQFRQEPLADVLFVPLVGVEGWEDGELELNGGSMREK